MDAPRVWKVVLDTNVLIASCFPGACRRIVSYWQAGQLRVVTSVELQLYSRWELLVPHVPPGTSARQYTNDPLDTATGDYVTFLTAGDRLYPSALAELVRAINAETQLTGNTPKALYTDERTIRPDGSMSGDPLLKPGWSPRLLRGHDYIGALAAYDRSIVPRPLPDGDHALALAVAVRTTFTHVPHVAVQRRSRPVVASAPPPSFRGRASIIIPTRDRRELLEACVSSVLRRTDHPDFEILVVDNGTVEPSALAYLHDLPRRDPRVRVIPSPGPFNFARLCNLGVAEAGGDVVVLLNNDTEVITPDWLTVLAGWAMDEGAGAVGPQLRYPDGRIQHAGLAGLAEQGTGHLFVARDPHGESPMGLAGVTREVLAVTGACLAVSRDSYRAVGGLAEHLIPNDSGDVDLCLRLRAAGLANIYAADAVLLHHESPSRGRSFVDAERFYLQRRWPAELLSDPYLNPNLAKSTRYEPDFRFGLPEVPTEVFHRWLADGALPPLTV